MPTTEHYERIKQLAFEFVAEIEWFDLEPFDRDGWDPKPGADSLRDESTRTAQAPLFQRNLRGILAVVFDRVGPDAWTGHQEAELEAAGIVQAAIRRELARLCPHWGIVLYTSALITKFQRLPLPCRTAKPRQYVPSMAEQLAGGQKAGA